MAIFQPSNITPSTLSGVSSSTVAVADNIRISWQVNGNSPMTGFQIDILQNNAASTLVHTTGVIALDSPFYGKDAKGNPQFYVYSPASTAWSAWGMTDGNQYKMKITQFWGDNPTAQSETKIVQYSDSLFNTRSQPTITLKYGGSDIPVPFTLDKVKDTFTAVYEQAQNDSITWVRWVLTNNTTNTPIIDTGKVDTLVLEFEHDGYLNDNEYTITVTVETENGIQATDTATFTVSYVSQSTRGNINISCTEDNALLLSWAAATNIPGTPSSGDGYSIQDGKLIIKKDENVTYSAINDSALIFSPPYAMAIKSKLKNPLEGTFGITDMADSKAYYSPDGTKIVVIRSSTAPVGAKYYTVTDGAVSAGTDIVLNGTPQSVSFYPDSTKFVIALSGASDNGVLKLFSAGASAATFVKNISTSGKWMYTTDISNDGKILVAGGQNILTIYSISNNDAFTVITGATGGESLVKNCCICITPGTSDHYNIIYDGRNSYSEALNNVTISGSIAIDFTYQKLAYNYEAPCYAVSSDGSKLVTAGYYNYGVFAKTYRYDSAANKYIFVADISNDNLFMQATSASFDSDGDMLAIGVKNYTALPDDINALYIYKVTASNQYQRMYTAELDGTPNNISFTDNLAEIDGVKQYGTADMIIGTGVNAYAYTENQTTDYFRFQFGASHSYDITLHQQKFKLRIMNNGSELYQDFSIYPNTDSFLFVLRSTGDGKNQLYSFDELMNAIYYEEQNAFINSNLRSKLILDGEQTVDYVYITQNQTYSFETVDFVPSWDNDTLFYADYISNLNAGTFSDDVGQYANALYSLHNSVLRPICKTATAINQVKDYSVRSRNMYSYRMYYVNNNTYSTLITSTNAQPNFKAYSLIEAIPEIENPTTFHVRNVWNFKYNINAGQISNNNNPSFLQNFTKYPLYQPSAQAAKSGTLSALIGSVNFPEYKGTWNAETVYEPLNYVRVEVMDLSSEEITEPIEKIFYCTKGNKAIQPEATIGWEEYWREGEPGSITYDNTAEQMEALFDISTSPNTFFVKDMIGNLYMVKPSAPITQEIQTNTEQQAVTVSIPWQEIDSCEDISLIQLPTDEGWRNTPAYPSGENYPRYVNVWLTELQDGSYKLTVS